MIIKDGRNSYDVIPGTGAAVGERSALLLGAECPMMMVRHIRLERLEQ